MSKVKILNASETELFLESLLFCSRGTHGKFKSTRNYCICCLMLYAGLRVSEAAQITIADVYNRDLPIRALMVRKEIAKRHHERLIPINKPLAQAILTFLKLRFDAIQTQPDEFLFVSATPGKHITVRQIQRIVERHSTKSIGQKIHPHTLRHTFATRLMRVTSIRVVQELLGHKNLSSTQIYTHPNSDDMRLAIEAIK